MLAEDVSKMYLCEMKVSQTLKLDPKLLKGLKQHAKKMEVPFNRYVESVLKTHYMIHIILNK